MMAWLFVLLAVSCSLALAHLLKTGEHLKLNRVRVITVNYLSATVVSVLQSVLMGGELKTTQMNPEVLLIAAYLGLMFITVFLVLSRSIHVNGVGISVTSMRISLLLPVVFGFLFFGEAVTLSKITGIILVIISLLLLLKQEEKAFHKIDGRSMLLLVLFGATGVNDILLKYYDINYRGIISESWFTSLIFFTAFICGLLYLAIRHNLKIKRAEWKYGLSIGIINLYSTVFLLYALRDLDASTVFPAINISVVIGSTLIGILGWQDQLGSARKIGLAIACLSLLLLI
jgi:drug/metabolite transporter (DMT)-like permease